MVSLRRRRLLGYCTEAEKSNVSENNATPILDLNVAAEEAGGPFEEIGNEEMDNEEMGNDSGSSNEQPIQSPKEIDTQTKENDTQSNIELEVKQRKQHRRRRIHGDEQPMIGVYFKNKKWQAAIKVNRIQIHLGTVNTQEEATHLYDRAAFMRGREPNFELPEEEKEQLRKLKWAEFLAMTRRAIFKEPKRRRAAIKAVPPSQNSDEDGEQRAAEGSSASDDANPDTPTTI